MNELEKVRRSFRPRHITTLFVGESPPHSGVFFYKGDSQLYYRVKEAFGHGRILLRPALRYALPHLSKKREGLQGEDGRNHTETASQQEPPMKTTQQFLATLKRVATDSAFLSVGFSHANVPNSQRLPSPEITLFAKKNPRTGKHCP
jgi:hypothetical protein